MSPLENKHPPFAEALFEGLRGAADTTLGKDNGIIAATELYCYVRDKVEELTDEHDKGQTPSLFPSIVPCCPKQPILSPIS